MILEEHLGNVRDINLVESIETDELRVESARLYGGLVFQAVMRTNDDQLIVNSYGPGYRRMKYILAVATQIGCPVRCREICSVPKYQRDLSANEISNQVELLLRTVEKAGLYLHDNLKIAMVKEGDALLNRFFPEVLRTLSSRYSLPFKISTTFPRSRRSSINMEELIRFASDYSQTVQLQISLGSTDEEYRRSLTAYPTTSFELIGKTGELWSDSVTNGRLINLSFTLYEETSCNPEEILDVLSPKYFAIRIRDAIESDVTPIDRTHLSETRFQELRKRFELCGYRVFDGRTGDVEGGHNLATGQYKVLRELARGS